MRRLLAVAVFAAALGWGGRAHAIQIELGTYNFLQPRGDTLYGAGLLNDFHFGGPLSFLYGFHLVLDKSSMLTDLNLGPLLQIGGPGPAVRVGGMLLVVFQNGFKDNPSYILGGGKGILGGAWVFDNGRSVYLDLELQYGAVLDAPVDDPEQSRLGLNVWFGFAF